MTAISKFLRSAEGGRLAFWCPGCNDLHMIAVGAGTGSRWSYNGNPDAPTFTPSVLVRKGHYACGEAPGNCYCDAKARLPTLDFQGHKCYQCHSFVTDGRIQFLSDCTHELAGQTVLMVEKWEKDRAP